jgi:hypothetical protein
LAPGTSRHVAQKPPSLGSPRCKMAVRFLISETLARHAVGRNTGNSEGSRLCR